MRDGSEIVIRDVRPDDRDDALRVLDLAFADAPDLQLLVGSGPGAADRLRRLNEMAFESSARVRIIVAELDSEIVGVLTWADLPDCSAMSPRQMLTLLRIVGRRLIGAGRLFVKASRVHPKAPHRHIPQIGVDPDHQGHGVGSALVVEMCRRCDEEGVAAYLETFVWADGRTPSLRTFYERFGFSVAHEIPMGEGWSGLTMLRPARQVDGEPAGPRAEA